MNDDTDTDTTTPATDAELVEIELKARARKVLHWPELVRLINRLRQAEVRAGKLEVLVEQAFKDGIAYANNVSVKDANLAWETSLVRAYLSEQTQ